MTVKIYQNADNLDPAGTANPESLKGYITEVTAAIKAEFPDADVIHYDQDNTYCIEVIDGDDDNDDSTERRINDIASEVYATGNFWL